MATWCRVAAAVVLLSVAGLQYASTRLGSQAARARSESRREIDKIEREFNEIDDPEAVESLPDVLPLVRRSEREYSQRSVVLYEAIESQRQLLLISHLILGVTGLLLFGFAVAAEPDSPGPLRRLAD